MIRKYQFYNWWTNPRRTFMGFKVYSHVSGGKKVFHALVLGYFEFRYWINGWEDQR
jgi:hypothetical protein